MTSPEKGFARSTPAAQGCSRAASERVLSGCMKRLFFGLELSEEARDALDRLLPSLEGCGHLHSHDLFHLTLCFLGITPAEAIPTLTRLARLAAVPPFSLTLHGLGTFKDGRILWAGVRPSPILTAMQKKLDLLLRENGFLLEDKPYSPHITLGRSMKSLPPCGDPDEVTFTVRGITLFESLRDENDRLVYRPLDRTW